MVHIKPLDLIATSCILGSLYFMYKTPYIWALYCAGCCCWMILHCQAGNYCGVVMECAAIVLGIRNYLLARKVK